MSVFASVCRSPTMTVCIHKNHTNHSASLISLWYVRMCVCMYVGTYTSGACEPVKTYCPDHLVSDVFTPLHLVNYIVVLCTQCNDDLISKACDLTLYMSASHALSTTCFCTEFSISTNANVGNPPYIPPWISLPHPLGFGLFYKINKFLIKTT